MILTIYIYIYIYIYIPQKGISHTSDPCVATLPGVSGNLTKRRILLRVLFESLSRTVTCTRELSAFICVIPRGTDLIPPCLGYST